MSHHALPPVRQEDDRIRGVLVFGAIVAATLFATLCVFIMWFLWRANARAFNPAALQKPKEVIVGEPAIGGVNQTMINVDTATRRLNNERLRQLEQLRWIDRGAGVAQIPIEEAMRALIVGTSPALGAIAGAGPPGGGPGREAEGGTGPADSGSSDEVVR